MIKDRITQELKEALKKGDGLRASTLRLLSSALHNEEIARQKRLTEEEELVVVRRELKKREEAAEAYEKGGRPESAEKERKEAEILEEFLPTQIPKESLEEVVKQVIREAGASGLSDFGKVMGVLMKRIKGQADGRVIAEVVREKLAESSL